MEETRKQMHNFIIKLQGKDYVLFEGLLNLAHQEGLKKINTKLIQLPAADNAHTAVVWAEVETEKGLFTGIGDASPGSVSKGLIPHTIRMAETRAIARALRFAVNIGMTTVEELCGLEEEKKTEIDEVVLDFGKYANHTLSEVLLLDRNYVEWLSQNARDLQIRNLAKQLVNDFNPEPTSLN